MPTLPLLSLAHYRGGREKGGFRFSWGNLQKSRLFVFAKTIKLLLVYREKTATSFHKHHQHAIFCKDTFQCIRKHISQTGELGTSI